MPKPCILSFKAGHISFTNNVVSLVNKLGRNNATIRSIKKHFHPLIIFHNGLNVSADLSPIVRAKIPADILFTAVRSQILFFLLPTNVGNSSMGAPSGISSRPGCWNLLYPASFTQLITVL
jgi:hypothetical protein